MRALVPMMAVMAALVASATGLAAATAATPDPQAPLPPSPPPPDVPAPPSGVQEPRPTAAPAPVAEPLAPSPPPSAAPPPTPTPTPAPTPIGTVEPTPADSDEPSPGKWYVPTSDDPKEPARAKERRPTVWPAAVLWDVHGFPFKRSVNGMGSEFRARFGTAAFGVTAGAYVPGAQLDLGLDFFRYYGVVLTEIGSMQFTLDLPTLEPRVFYRPESRGWTGAAGTALTGLRVTKFPFVVDLRLPRVDFWVGPFDERARTTWSLGGSLSVGIVL